MQIVKTQKIDKQTIDELVDIIVKGIEPYVTNRLVKYAKRKSVSSKHNNFIILRENSKTLGFIMYRIMNREQVFIYEIQVLKEFQSQGYGSKLMNELFNSEKDKEFVLFVYNKNIRAAKFYSSLGFKKVWEDELVSKMIK